jgi:4-hydroxybenzoate polyprenyltransferase
MSSVHRAAAAAVLASRLPPDFQLALGGYAVLSLTYSFFLKGRLLLDVLTLACLYSVRVVAGALLVGVVLSRWFMAFSLFLFFALAVAKRVSELRAQNGDPHANGRSYLAADQYPLLALGASATAAACLVYCLYITSGAAVALYQRPDLLWGGLPLLLYCQSRIWVFAFRATLTEDPVAFALGETHRRSRRRCPPWGWRRPA